MCKVLIVSKDSLVREALTAILEKIPLRKSVEQAADLEMAVFKCRHNLVDIVFLDSPAGDLSVLKKINDSSIYLMVNYLQNNFLEKKTEYHIKGFLEKPLTFPKINQLLQAYENTGPASTRDTLSELLTIIKRKDYFQLYRQVGEINETLYEQSDKDNVRVRKLYLHAGNCLLRMAADYYANEESPSVETLFPFKEGQLLDRYACEIWLYSIMEFIFEKNCSRGYPLIKSVLDYINLNIKKNISLKNIIENCSISQGYLSRIFKEQFNVSVMDYLHMRKMRKTKEYLCFTEESIADIGFRLGYNESSYFCKVFKKYEGITCKQYRDIVRNEKIS